MRELMGDDGEEIAVFMRSVMRDEAQKMRDRLDAAKWLADRGFGRTSLATADGAERWIIMPDLDGLPIDDLTAVAKHLDAVEKILAPNLDA